ncbi:MAG TPA: alpha/beta hydrolase [Lentimicrobium sp.]|nr:alpha/beta hydrolase [Lentimicrobium sp.]
MPSFKARSINLLLRNRHILNGKFRKETYDMNTSIQGFRDLCEKGASRYAKIPDGISIKPDSIQGIKSEWIIPAGTDEQKLVMYVHGGGYVSGSCSDHRGFVSKLAKRSGYIHLVYEYRLAPEHPFPAAVDDSVMVYRHLIQEKGFEPENILLTGESAGGGLVLALLLALKDEKLLMPVAAVSVSPWADLTCSGESYKTKNKRSLAPTNSWLVFSKHYCGATDPMNPLVSPLFGNPEGLPPIFINSGTDDELFDDGKRFYLKAKEKGVDITFRAGEGMVHCYPLFSPVFKEAKEAMDEICDFIDKHLGRKDHK